MLSMKSGTVTQLGLFNDPIVDKKKIKFIVDWYGNGSYGELERISFINASFVTNMKDLIDAGIKIEPPIAKQLIMLLFDSVGDGGYLGDIVFIENMSMLVNTDTATMFPEHPIRIASKLSTMSTFKRFLRDCEAFGIPYVQMPTMFGSVKFDMVKKV